MAIRRWTVEETGDFIHHCEVYDLVHRREMEQDTIKRLCTEGEHEKAGTLRMVPIIGRRQHFPDDGPLPVSSSTWHDVVVDIPPFMPDPMIPLYVEEIIKSQLDEAWGEVPDWRGKTR